MKYSCPPVSFFPHCYMDHLPRRYTEMTDFLKMYKHMAFHPRFPFPPLYRLSQDSPERLSPIGTVSTNVPGVFRRGPGTALRRHTCTAHHMSSSLGATLSLPGPGIAVPPTTQPGLSLLSMVENPKHGLLDTLRLALNLTVVSLPEGHSSVPFLPP